MNLEQIKETLTWKTMKQMKSKKNGVLTYTLMG